MIISFACECVYFMTHAIISAFGRIAYAVAPLHSMPLSRATYLIRRDAALAICRIFTLSHALWLGDRTPINFAAIDYPRTRPSMPSPAYRAYFSLDGLIWLLSDMMILPPQIVFLYTVISRRHALRCRPHHFCA